MPHSPNSGLQTLNCIHPCPTVLPSPCPLIRVKDGDSIHWSRLPSLSSLLPRQQAPIMSPTFVIQDYRKEKHKIRDLIWYHNGKPKNKTFFFLKFSHWRWLTDCCLNDCLNDCCYFVFRCLICQTEAYHGIDDKDISVNDRLIPSFLCCSLDFLLDAADLGTILRNHRRYI